MPPRTLTIAATSPKGSPACPAVPRLELAGLWLEDAGFPVGTQVRLELVEPGCLLLTREEEEDLDAQPLLPLVWIPAEQIAAVERAAAARAVEAGHA